LCHSIDLKIQTFTEHIRLLFKLPFVYNFSIFTSPRIASVPCEMIAPYRDPTLGVNQNELKEILKAHEHAP
jgi:hypothetical protein